MKGMTLQKEQDRHLAMAVKEEFGLVNAMPMTDLKNVDYEFGEAKVSSIPRVSGGKVPIIFNEANFKRRYT